MHLNNLVVISPERSSCHIALGTWPQWIPSGHLANNFNFKVMLSLIIEGIPDQALRSLTSLLLPYAFDARD
jgi:hypothetical protein